MVNINSLYTARELEKKWKFLATKLQFRQFRKNVKIQHRKSELKI